MEQRKRRRNNDIDEDTELRRITTLDIIDEYPFLSKQLQASSYLRNINFNSSLININDDSIRKLISFLNDLIQKYFSEELEFTVFERDNIIGFNISDKGRSVYVYRYEKLIKQPFYTSLRIIRTGDMECTDEFWENFNKLKKEENNWYMNNNIENIEEKDECYHNDIKILESEIEKFVKRYFLFLQQFNITFYYKRTFFHDGMSVLFSNVLDLSDIHE